MYNPPPPPLPGFNISEPHCVRRQDALPLSLKTVEKNNISDTVYNSAYVSDEQFFG